MVEWLCSGLQLRRRRFDSGSRLHIKDVNFNMSLEKDSRFLVCGAVVKLVDTQDLKSCFLGSAGSSALAPPFRKFVTSRVAINIKKSLMKINGFFYA